MNPSMTTFERRKPDPFAILLYEENQRSARLQQRDNANLAFKHPPTFRWTGV